MTGMTDVRKPLRSRLLAVPSLRAKYLEHVREIAKDSLSWEKLGPIVAAWRAQISAAVAADTRKAMSFAAFETAVADSAIESADARTMASSLRTFADRRSTYLLQYKPADAKSVDDASKSPTTKPNASDANR